MYVRGSSYLSRIFCSKKNGTSAEFQNVIEVECSFRSLEKCDDLYQNVRNVLE
jgi:hypothetical protein